MILRLKLKEIMMEKGITQVQLSEKTGLRQATISDLWNMKKDNIHIPHLEKIVAALNIDDPNMIFEFIRTSDQEQKETSNDEPIESHVQMI